jgi:hypothetical protein
MKMEAVWSFKILVSYHIATWHHNPEDYNLNRRDHFRDVDVDDKIV